MSVRLEIHVRPNASRTSVGGSHDGALVVHVAAPPESGKATDAAIRAVAGALDVAARDVTLVRGATSRRKVLSVPASDDVRRRIDQLHGGQ